MNANWVKLVSVAALALAGTLAVACSSDDDDDDNPGTQGKSGASGTGGSAGGGSGTGGTGGSAGGGSGSAGASGAGGGGMVALPPVNEEQLKAALLNGGTGAPKYSPTVAPAKWACSDPDDDATEDELKSTDVGFHGGPADARYCSNYNLSGVTYDQTDGWPLGAAAMKETLDANGDITEWSYYALTGDGKTWYGVKVTPSEPVARDEAIPSDVTLDFAPGNCTKSGCHADAGNTNVLEWVIRGDAVPHDNAMWLTPNPYKQ
jgi:hypothetical protein